MGLNFQKMGNVAGNLPHLTREAAVEYSVLCADFAPLIIQTPEHAQRVRENVAELEREKLVITESRVGRIDAVSMMIETLQLLLAEYECVREPDAAPAAPNAVLELPLQEGNNF